MGKKAKEAKDGDKGKQKRQRQESFSKVTNIAYLAVALFGVVLAIGAAKWGLSAPADPYPDFPEPPDVRPGACPKEPKVASKDAHEAVTVIVPYLNEEWFRIRATLESIVRYTDMSLVKEIVWISDGNTPDKVFAQKIKAFHRKITVHENDVNLGLIKTKMEAAARAAGSILVFLEPHILVTPGWLEPLVNRVHEMPKALVMPALDVLDESLKYHEGVRGHWRFEWNMNLVYSNPEQKTFDSAEAFMSPATSGGIYAIRKSWWDELQFYDPELVRWGGDHVEASHKVWRCGGRIEIHPCSHVGHWFRLENVRPYDVKVESVVRNYKRLAEVWFDNYTANFYKVKPEAQPLDVGVLDDMRERRSKLQCEDMQWYLRNVDLELHWEADRICIPGAGKEYGGCKSATPAPRMTTIDKVIPRRAYEKLKQNASAFRI